MSQTWSGIPVTGSNGVPHVAGVVVADEPIAEQPPEFAVVVGGWHWSNGIVGPQHPVAGGISGCVVEDGGGSVVDGAEVGKDDVDVGVVVVGCEVVDGSSDVVEVGPMVVVVDVANVLVDVVTSLVVVG